MPENSFTIDIDGTRMREALEGESLKAEIAVFVKAAARISADNIAKDAAARLQRQLSGTSSGRTVAGIKVKSAGAWGWKVDAGNVAQPMLDRWLEFSTKHMKARAFFFDSAKLEKAAHTARVRSAIQAALSVHGLGDQQ